MPRWRVLVSKLKHSRDSEKRIAQEKRRQMEAKGECWNSLTWWQLPNLGTYHPEQRIMKETDGEEKEKLCCLKTDISPHPGSESEDSLLQGNFFCIKYQPAALWFVIRFRRRPLRAWWGTFEVSARQLYCHRNTSVSWEGVLLGAEKNWAMLQRHSAQ